MADRNNKRVLVLWAKPTATNLGIRVLAEGVIRLAQEAFGDDAEIVVHDHDTPETPLGKRPILQDVGRRNGAVKKYLRTFDVVIDTGSGDSFTDIYGLRRLTVMTYVHHAAIQAGVPLVLAPQTIGPFDTRLGKLLAGHTLKRATRVYARDSLSESYAQEFGRRVDGRSPDVVFVLDQANVERTGDLYLNVSGLLWRENSHVPAEMYRSLVTEFVKANRSAGRRVVLFPHVLRSATSREDDTTAVEEAAALLRADGCEVDLFVPESLDEVRRTLAGASAVVAARMHACLNALSVGTPAVAWAYSRKFEGLFGDLDWPYFVDLRSATTEHAVTSTLSQVAQATEAAASVDKLQSQARDELAKIVADLRAVAR